MRTARIGAMVTLTTLALGTIPVTLGAFAVEAAAKGTKTAEKPEVSESSRVLSKLHHVNQLEVELGRLAKTKAAAQDVKDYADHMVKDHSDADKMVMDYAKKNNVAIPPLEKSSGEEATLSKEKDLRDKLRKLSGKDFDKEFLGAMVSGHNDAINLMTDARKKNIPADLSEMLGKLQPTFEQHRNMAETLLTKERAEM